MLAKVAGKLVAQTEAGWAAQLKKDRPSLSEGEVQDKMAQRERDGNCLFVLAMVSKEWRKAQLKVGGRLRTRVKSDVIMPGQAGLAKWALAEGCPRDAGYGFSMAHAAAQYGRQELVQWLCGEGGFAMDKYLMSEATKSGKLELVQWLRGAGCPWDYNTCISAVKHGRVEVLRWARENGCPWIAQARAAAAILGYYDNFGNLVDYAGNPVRQL